MGDCKRILKLNRELFFGGSLFLYPKTEGEGMKTVNHEENIFVYDKFNRIKYHPDLHGNHGKPWTSDELEYLCKFHNTAEWDDIGFAIGRPGTSCAQKLVMVKRDGQYEFYRKLNKYYV